MKIKYIAAIFVYFTTFTMSVLLVGLPVSKSRSYKKPCDEKRPAVATTETDLQVRIRKFLEADHQTGIELANDKARLRQSNNWLATERLATVNLVEKMKKVECGDGMPKDFCIAWEDHLTTWKYKAYLLDRYHKSGPTEREIASEQISNSYQKMLAAARRHGVDFRF